MNDKIYSITCFFFDETLFKDGLWTFASQKRERRWGFYFDVQHALKVVNQNITDIYEHGHYNYVVITEENPGIVSDSKEWWFKVNMKKGGSYDVKFLNESIFPGEFSYPVQNQLPE